MSSDISIILPVYNEEQSLAEFYTCLLKVIDSGAETFEVIFINDGSEDQTESMLRQLRQRDPRVKAHSFFAQFRTPNGDHSRFILFFPNSWGSLERWNHACIGYPWAANFTAAGKRRGNRRPQRIQ